MSLWQLVLRHAFIALLHQHIETARLINEAGFNEAIRTCLTEQDFQVLYSAAKLISLTGI